MNSVRNEGRPPFQGVRDSCHSERIINTGIFWRVNVKKVFVQEHERSIAGIHRWKGAAPPFTIREISRSRKGFLEERIHKRSKAEPKAWAIK